MKPIRLAAIAIVACLLSACAFHRDAVKADVVGVNDKQVPIVINGPVVQQPTVTSNLWLHSHVNFLTHQGFSLYDFYTQASVSQLLKANLDHTLGVMELPIADLANYKIQAKALGLDIETSQMPATIHGNLLVQYQLFNGTEQIWSKTIQSNAQMGYADSGNEQVAVGDLMSFLLNNNTSEFAEAVASHCRFNMSTIDCGDDRQVW